MRTCAVEVNVHKMKPAYKKDSLGHLLQLSASGRLSMLSAAPSLRENGALSYPVEQLRITSTTSAYSLAPTGVVGKQSFDCSRWWPLSGKSP